MTQLNGELHRLYCLPGQPAPTADADFRQIALVSEAGQVRALVLGVTRGSDWETVAGLYLSLVESLELPAPAVAVCAAGGYQVWLSLAEAVPLAQARAFLEGLRRRYLGAIPAARLQLWPGATAETQCIATLPCLDEDSGRWSAFIDPAMGSMFCDELGLDLAPNNARQADMLAGLRSVTAREWQRALAILGDGEEGAVPPPPGDPSAAAGAAALGVGGGFTDPRSFLLAVMNDPTASGHDRVEAAKALLPYFERPLA